MSDVTDFSVRPSPALRLTASRADETRRPDATSRGHFRTNPTPVLMAVAVAALMLVAGFSSLHASSPTAPSTRDQGSSAGPSSALTPTAALASFGRANVGGACHAGGSVPAGPVGSDAPSPRAGGTTGPSALFNNQVTPYAAMTGPYAYVARGAALRDQGYGSINITWPGGSSTLIAAYLVWSILNNSVPPDTATFDGTNISGTWTAYATPSPCWSPTYIYTFVDSVTSLVVNGANSLKNFPSGLTNGYDPWNQSQVTPMAEGASLIVIYDTGSSILHEVTLYTGALTTQGVTLTSQLNYSTANTTAATTTFLVADGQYAGNPAGWNGTVIDTNAFPGDDPKASPYAWSYGNLSDTKTYQVNVTLGSNNTTASVGSGGSDCLTWIGQVLSVGVASSPPPYNVTFQEQGLPNGQTWNITTHGTTHSGTVAGSTSSLSFTVGNGTHPYTVGAVPGYVTTPTGNYTIRGGSVYIRVPFHQLLYGVTFNETGLSISIGWTVTLTNASQSFNQFLTGYAPAGVAFLVPNGTYHYSVTDTSLYLPHPANGTVTVNGNNVELTIDFVPPPLYNVTFRQIGLPGGTTWGGATDTDWGYYHNYTTNASFTLQLPNATSGQDFFYPYGVTGYQVASYLYFTVTGGPEVIDVNYSTLYGVTITETGLPSGTAWGAYVYGSVGGYDSSTTANLSYQAVNGSYSFLVESPWSYMASPASGTINVSGANATVAVVFSSAPTYAVTFNETGLATGTRWSVSLELGNDTPLLVNITSNQTVLSLPNGSYYFVIESVRGYSAAPEYGSVDVYGLPARESIVFTPVYAVTFTETGLPSGSYWYVEFDYGSEASYSSTIVFWEENDSYSWSDYQIGGFTPTPTGGTVVVAGQPVNVSIAFVDPSSPTYNVEFVESGLPAGTNWSAELNLYTEWSTGSSINFTQTNGSFEYEVAGVGAYSANPSAGILTVSGGPATQTVDFSVSTSTYLATFTETGLPNGATWYVNITGEPSLSATVSGSSGTVLSTSLLNGSYTFSVATTESGWTTDAGGEFAVAGAAVYESVPFTAPGVTLYLVTFTESGLPNGATWYANISGQPGLSATVSGSLGLTLTLSLPNGSYSYAAASSDPGWYTTAGGALPVDGAPVPVSVPFTFSSTPHYAVTFTESGLPDGATWWANITGQPSLSGIVSGLSGTQLIVSLTNGSYSFTAATGAKGWSTHAGGPLSVAGSPVPVAVQFVYAAATASYSVTFTESGLPSGSTWWINVTGEPSLSATVSGSGGTQVSLTVVNGSYSYTAATNAKNWSAKGGDVTVAGSGQQVNVLFTSSGSPTTGQGSSSAFPWLWAGVGIGVLIAALLLLFLLGYRRRKQKEEPVQGTGPGSAGPGSGQAPPPPS